MACNLEQIMAAVVQAIGASAVPHGYGVDLYGKRSVPFIIWVRGPSTFGPPQGGTGNPRRLMTQKVQVLVHINATTEDEADALLQAEVVGLTRIANTSVRLIRVDAMKPEEPKTWGTEMTLTIEVDVPVLDQVKEVAKAKTITFEHVSVADDGWLEYGE